MEGKGWMEEGGLEEDRNMATAGRDVKPKLSEKEVRFLLKSMLVSMVTKWVAFSGTCARTQ